MKGLPSSLRPKKRYLAFRVVGDEAVSRDEVVRGIWREALSFLGEARSSELHLWVLNFDEERQEGFLVCGHRSVGEVRAVLTLIGELGGKRVVVKPLGVSGTIRALKRRFLNEEVSVEDDRETGEFPAGWTGRFMGKDIKVARVHKGCIDVRPSDEELSKRLREFRMRFVGLTDRDLRGERDATISEHGV
jgi:ribonuclease P/MRP protein subunit POP5